MRYAFTRDKSLVVVGRKRKSRDSTDCEFTCEVVLWSAAKRKFIRSEIRTYYEDELEFLSATDAKEALAVERREAEAEADAIAEDFLKDMLA